MGGLIIQFWRFVLKLGAHRRLQVVLGCGTLVPTSSEGISVAKRISIINFKGGVGKTTLAFHLATGLARFHDASVLLVDVDHQSSLSALCLQPRRWLQLADDEKTINEVFSSFVRNGEMPGTEIIARSPIRHLYTRDRSRRYKGYDNIDLVPARLQLDNTEIELTRTIAGDPVRSEWDKRTLICRWIEETGVDDEYDYIIFDCPPATKVVSQNAVAASHGYIVPVVPEAVMERGAPHLEELMETGIDNMLKALALMGDPRPIHVPDTQLIGLVVTRIEVHGMTDSGYTNIHTTHLEALQSRWGTQLIEPYIVQGVGVIETLTSGNPVYGRSGDPNIERTNVKIDEQYRELTSELASRIGKLIP